MLHWEKINCIHKKSNIQLIEGGGEIPQCLTALTVLPDNPEFISQHPHSSS